MHLLYFRGVCWYNSMMVFILVQSSYGYAPRVGLVQRGYDMVRGTVRCGTVCGVARYVYPILVRYDGMV